MPARSVAPRSRARRAIAVSRARATSVACGSCASTPPPAARDSPTASSCTACATPGSSSTARRSPTSRCATPKRSDGLPSEPGRLWQPERSIEPQRDTPGAPCEAPFLMIRSADNDKLKTIRKLHDGRWREKLDLFVAEGEDLVEAAWDPEFVLVAGEDVEPELLDGVSTLGSGARVIGVYRRRWSQPGGDLSVYLHAVGDPGNVGAVIRSAHGLCDGPVVLGPGCADPWSPKAVRASMGSVFARPPARAGFAGLTGALVALDPRAETSLRELELSRPAVVCLGSEREGLPPGLPGTRASIPLRAGGPESLNVAAAAAVALWEVANRMAAHA